MQRKVINTHKRTNIKKDIFYAASFGDVTLLKQLVEEDKIDINTKDAEGATPLHWACYRNRIPCAKYLVEHG